MRSSDRRMAMNVRAQEGKGRTVGPTRPHVYCTTVWRCGVTYEECEEEIACGQLDMFCRKEHRTIWRLVYEECFRLASARSKR